jgi:translation initiation factor IF-2
VTIAQPSPTPTQEAPSASPTTPVKSGGNEVAPYSLSKGRRDPFVPFGGAMPEGNVTPQPEQTKAAETPKPAQPGQPPQQGGAPQKAAPPASVPVVVTGTFISGGKNFAIVQGEGGGPSFMVTTGDKVGEYYVKSVTVQRVVLTWSGRDYIVKMKAMEGPSKGGGSAAPTKGGESQQKSLPAPAQPQGPGNQGGAPGGGAPQQMGPPPSGGNQGGSAPGGAAPGGPGGGGPGGAPPKADGSKPN